MRSRIIVAVSVVWLLATLAPAAAAPAVHDSASMNWLPGPVFVEVPNSSVSLVATQDRARITVRTNGLPEGNAYTLWGFTFSSPENCSYPCGFDDAMNPAVGFNVQQIAGHVSGQSGTVNFGGSIAVENAQGAEYHIVIADHGALDPASLPEQIKTPHPGVVQIGFLGG